MRLDIKNLSVELQKQCILENINLTIEDGAFVSLLGESGCGKTTLLKSIAGLLEVGQGDIMLDGQSILTFAPEKRGTIIVFQDLRLFPHMSVEKNIRFPMELRKIPKEEQKRRLKELLQDVQLPGFEKRKIKEMSGGQMQRVALARALAAEPKLLLLDEPFSGLDEKLRMEMGGLVKKLQREKKITTILVTHDKREALEMSDKIALMHQGKVMQYGSAEQLLCFPENEVVSSYFGRSVYVSGKVKDGIFIGEDYRIACGEADGAYDAIMLTEANVCCFCAKEESKGE